MRSEDVIIDRLAEILKHSAYFIFKHIVINDVELDILALEPDEICFPRLCVTVYEIFTRAKVKALEKLEKRLDIADFVYAVVPLKFYSWYINRLPKDVGLILYNEDRVFNIKKAAFKGKGFKILYSNILTDFKTQL